MSKRPCPFSDDFQRQTKTRVNDQLANENSPTYMNQVYGARRASMQPPMLGDSMPGSSGLSSSATNADRVSIYEPDCDMEYEDYETYEMRLQNPGRELLLGDRPAEPECTTLPDIIPQLRASSVVQFAEDNQTIEDTPEDQTPPEFQPTYQRKAGRLSRLDLVKRLEKRDPSPIPTANNLLTSFIHTSRRTHGPFSESEKNILMHQAKTYKQLHIESFMQNQEVNQPSNEGQPREDNGESKDLNDNNNKPMDF